MDSVLTALYYIHIRVCLSGFPVPVHYLLKNIIIY